MALGMEVGLGPGRIVLDGEPARLPEKGAQSTQFSVQRFDTSGGKRKLGLQIQKRKLNIAQE